MSTDLFDGLCYYCGRTTTPCEHVKAVVAGELLAVDKEPTLNEQVWKATPGPLQITPTTDPEPPFQITASHGAQWCFVMGEDVAAGDAVMIDPDTGRLVKACT